MSINQQIWTNVGRDMLGRAQAGEQLVITTVVVGSGQATAPDDIFPLTGLINHVMDVAITQQVDQGDGVFLIDAAFNSSQAPVAFLLRELGVMAHIGTEADRLYTASNVMATGADNVDPAVQSIHAFKIKVMVDRSQPPTIIVGASGDILAENIGAETVGPGWFHEKIANTLRFKRAVAGDGIELIEDSLDPFSVTISQKFLRFNLDLYVPLSHPGGAPDTSFQTISEALDSLAETYIPPNLFATINVDTNLDPIIAPIVVNHPQAQQIRIIGSLGIVHNITSVGPTTGVSRAYTVPITITGAIDIIVGDWVMIDGVNVTIATAPHATLNNTFQVANVVGQVITINFPASIAFDLTAVNQGTMIKFRSVLNVVSGITGFEISGLSLLQNFAIIGDTIGIGLTLDSFRSTTIDFVGIARFTDDTSDAVIVYFGTHNFNLVRVNQCGNGFRVPRGAFLNCSECAASFSPGNLISSGYGFLVENGGKIVFTGYCLAMNNRVGLAAIFDSTILMGFGGALYNTGFGAYASNGGLVAGIGPGNLDFRANTTTDLYVTDLGHITVGRAPGIQYGTALPNIDTLTARGLIQITPPAATDLEATLLPA
jgi:hypothetical protein